MGVEISTLRIGSRRDYKRATIPHLEIRKHARAQPQPTRVLSVIKLKTWSTRDWNPEPKTTQDV
jgi:hypothetical protein